MSDPIDPPQEPVRATPHADATAGAPVSGPDAADAPPAGGQGDRVVGEAVSGAGSAGAPPPPDAAPRAPVGATLGRGVRAAWGFFAERRGVRVAMLGLALVVVSVWLGGGSALSLPLLVVGLAVLAAGFLGSRLRGHMNVSWGPDGSSIDLRAEVVAPHRHHAPVPPPAVLPLRPELTVARAPEPVIEGHGETIEMDVAQLRALLAAERTVGGAG